METNKEEVVKELRRVFCAPCTTANSCVGCLVDIAEDAVNASQQSFAADSDPAKPIISAMDMDDIRNPRYKSGR